MKCRIFGKHAGNEFDMAFAVLLQILYDCGMQLIEAKQRILKPLFQ